MDGEKKGNCIKKEENIPNNTRLCIWETKIEAQQRQLQNQKQNQPSSGVSGELAQLNKCEPAAGSPAHHYTLPAQTAIIRE